MMRRTTILVAFFALTIAPRDGHCADITTQQLKTSLDLGVRFLRSQQRADGTWPDLPMYGGGLTPLCTLALLNAGGTPDDETIARSLAYLRKAKFEATYATSLQTMVFCTADPQRDMHLIPAQREMARKSAAF